MVFIKTCLFQSVAGSRVGEQLLCSLAALGLMVLISKLIRVTPCSFCCIIELLQVITVFLMTIINLFVNDTTLHINPLFLIKLKLCMLIART